MLSYQMLIKAVRNATGAQNKIYPSDYSYVVIPMKSVRAVLNAFKPQITSSDPSEDAASARRLWYMFKEYSPRCACSLVRLSSPRCMDLVGIVTLEDLLCALPSYRLGDEIMRSDLLWDDIAEYSDHLFGFNTGAPLREQKAKTEDDCDIEMTMIDPYTKQIFKRSWGGTFGSGDWPVSSIKAFAVWF